MMQIFSSWVEPAFFFSFFFLFWGLSSAIKRASSLWGLDWIHPWYLEGNCFHSLQIETQSRSCYTTCGLESSILTCWCELHTQHFPRVKPQPPNPQIKTQSQALHLCLWYRIPFVLQKKKTLALSWWMHDGITHLTVAVQQPQAQTIFCSVGGCFC